MIVVSVVLILVAVTLLVLGVAGGSSTLLISSIAASLLAAIALVVGARQAAAMRRAVAPVPEPLAPDIHAGPGPDLPVAEPVGASEPDLSAPGAGTAAGARIPMGRQGRRRRRDETTPGPSFADDPPPSDEGLASPPGTKPRIAKRDDAEAALAADAAFRAETDPAAAGDDRDYHRASSVIDGARSENPDENAWRRPPDPRDAGQSGAELPDEFGVPDADDPDDEPLPQAVRPADAVRVARMPAEVLVVDGRPRYHLAECPHLVGRLTEPLPVAEAVELGFSPCGLCRPVDRLVARAAQF
jgi:hypothetical protein